MITNYFYLGNENDQVFSYVTVFGSVFAAIVVVFIVYVCAIVCIIHKIPSKSELYM